MGETRKRMKESGGGGGGGGFVNHSRTLPRTNFPHLHHRSRSHSHTFPHHYHAHPYPHPHPHIREVPFLTSVNVGPPAAHPIDFDDDDDHHHDPNPNHDLDHDRLRHHHHVHGLFGSETDTDDGKVTSATHTPSPHHLLNDSNETQTEEDDETTLREILVSLQRQVTVMSMNLNAKLDELQTRGDRQLETDIALCDIRNQLDHLTKSMASCQSDVNEVKRDIAVMKNEVDQVQQIRVEIEELREYVDRLEEQTHRRKLRLLQQGLTFFLSYTILASMLGMLQFGYNTGVINAPEGNIETFIKDVYRGRYNKDLPETTIRGMYSFAVSIFAVGGMLGGFSGGMIADRFGRKGGLLLNNFLGIGGACLMAFTKFFRSYEILFAGRFIIGVNCGLNTSLVPMYISEISPLNLRGGLGTVNQLAVTIGLLISQILGIKQILGTDDGWPVLLGLAVCPAILQLILLPVCPESPRYLLLNKQWEEEARKALRRLRASNQIEEDIEEMRAEERAERAEAAVSMLELMCSPTLRYPLMIGVVMQLSQQLSGINAVFYYSTDLFQRAGLPEDIAKFMTIGIGLIMFVMTIITIPLMDRMGRRSLHLYGLGGMFIFSIFITISFLAKEMVDWMSYLSVVSVLGYVVFFAVGPGSIPWMITAELFSQGPRPAAMSIAVLVNWMSNFLVGIGFQTLSDTLENYTFLPFSILLAFFWIFTYQRVPETKNKTFEEISVEFRRGGRTLYKSGKHSTGTNTKYPGDQMILYDRPGEDAPPGIRVKCAIMYPNRYIFFYIFIPSVLTGYRDSFRDTTPYGSMLNCVNALEQRIPVPPPPTERASLMVSEEKPIPDTCMEEFMVEPTSRPPPPLPPPRFSRSVV